jgi:hyperosmotically inducible protein
MRRVHMTFVLGLIVLSTLAFVGCRSATGRSFGQQWDDKVISTQVKTKLTTDRAANLLSTGVGTQFGIVRLTGTVQTPEQRAEAERIASNVAGVRGVKNEILVVPKDEGLRTSKAGTPTAGPAVTTPAPAASPATSRPLALSGQVTAVNPTNGDVTVKTATGDNVVLRFPTATAAQIEQGQQISINAGAAAK